MKSLRTIIWHSDNADLYKALGFKPITYLRLNLARMVEISLPAKNLVRDQIADDIDGQYFIYHYPYCP